MTKGARINKNRNSGCFPARFIKFSFRSFEKERLKKERAGILPLCVCTGGEKLLHYLEIVSAVKRG